MRASNPSWSRNVEIQPLHECEAEASRFRLDSLLSSEGHRVHLEQPRPGSAGGGPRLAKQACGLGARRDAASKHRTITRLPTQEFWLQVLSHLGRDDHGRREKSATRRIGAVLLVSSAIERGISDDCPAG